MVAQRAPFKYEDTEHVASLQAGCTTVERVASEVHGRWEPKPPGDALQRPVCFDASAPTLKQVIAAMRTQAQVKMTYAYCGNAGSVLQGGSPIGEPWLSVEVDSARNRDD